MRCTSILAILLVACTSIASAQTRAQNQEKLLQFLKADLQLSPDQVTQVRGFITDADNTMASSEMQYASNPTRATYVHKQIIMDLGKKIETILTPSQREQYPKTKQKLYDFLQARYKAGIDKEQQEGAKAKEMEPVETREPH